MTFEPVRPSGLPPLPKVSQMAMLVDDANMSQLDMYAQIVLRELPKDPHANLAAAYVAQHFELHEKFKFFYQFAIQTDRNIVDLAADLHIDFAKLNQFMLECHQFIDVDDDAKQEKFHIIKAWGFGFGAEMFALMGQIYLAEVLNRTPIVHWGENFLYRQSGSECVFSHFFEPFNRHSISSLSEGSLQSVFPPKWNANNIMQENMQKKTGPYAKLSALYFLNTAAEVTVADYFTGIINIRPWLPAGHHFESLDHDETYRYLMKKYLRPLPQIQALADSFAAANFSGPFLAVHARGSDKDEGYRTMTSIPGQTIELARKRLSEMPEQSKLFLMTDDESLLSVYRQTFGERLVTTDSQRSNSETGVHYDPNSNKRSAGQEMLVDMLIAAQSACFIGLGLSNPSQLICYMADFEPENYILFGESRLKQFNTHLYKTIPVR